MGTVASVPYAGTAWGHMHIVGGLKRLGHEVHYFETTSAWPYDPVRRTPVCDSDYALPYLQRVLEGFGLADHWAYRRSYLDGAWLGPSANQAGELLAHADAVFNVGGATPLDKNEVGRLVYFDTDPVIHELSYDRGDTTTRWMIDQHDDIVTYGENIGRPGCAVPPLPRLRSRTRQPVLLDLWDADAPSRAAFTTVGNWKQEGYDVEWRGEIYLWSKHHEFLKFIELPTRIAPPIEIATNLKNLDPESRRLLDANRWHLVDAQFTADPWRYRDYVQTSRGEFTVAKDQNVRFRSGWFSDRSASYLAAGRPVITQDTGFGTVLPVGEGLFSFNTLEDIVSAFAAIEADYARHSRAARTIAEECFRAETVLARVLSDLGLA